MQSQILIIDDNPEFCATLADIMKSRGWVSRVCYSPEDGFDVLKTESFRTSMALLDIEFTTSQQTGIDALAHITRNYPGIPVVMISGKGTIENAVKATKLGAVNFIEKSLLNREKLTAVIASTLERVSAQNENSELLKIIEAHGITGKSRAIMSVADKIVRYGKTDLNIMVTGETGTGKKLVAQAIHAVSRRSKYPFVTVDIPNIPRDLFQSELFGHIKGSFSGAMENKRGLFHQANKGTLFLDEIGDLSPELQANLLLPVEEKTIRRVGSVESEVVDLRFVSATDKDLVMAMKDARFREQLYHRLRECEITIPPLRDRREDIPLIVEHYVRKHNATFEEHKMFSSAALEYLQYRDWQGNVRELVSVIRVCLQTVEEEVIEVADVHRTVSKPGSERSYPTAGHAVPPDAFVGDDGTLKDKIAVADKRMIEQTLDSCKGNVSKAAAKLGISRETLHNKIRKYSINTQDYRSK